MNTDGFTVSTHNDGPTITGKQCDTLTELVKLGYNISQIYNDGVVNVSKVFNASTVMVFVYGDGSIGHPRTSATMIASIELTKFDKS